MPYYMKKYKPKIVGITAKYPQLNSLIKIADYVKRYYPKTAVVAGGYLASLSPEDLFKWTKHIDFCVMGEGEVTFLGLSKKILSGERDFEKVKGLAFIREGKLVITPKRPFIKDINSLPFPKEPVRWGHGAIIFSRGCPFGCYYCSVGNFCCYTHRVRSIPNIIAELKDLKRRGAKRINVLDDCTFPDPRKWDELIHEVRRNNLHSMEYRLGVTPIAIIRDPLLPEKLGSMNVTRIAFGIETMNPGARKYLKVRAKVPDPDKFVEALRKSKFTGRIILNQIINTGREKSIEEIKRNSMQVFEAVKDIKHVGIQPFILTPYPGSDITQELEAKGCMPHTKMRLKMETLRYPTLSQKQIRDWFEEYTELLCRAGKFDFTGDFIGGITNFLFSTMRPSTKLKIAWEFIKYYSKHSSQADHFRFFHAAQKYL